MATPNVMSCLLFKDSNLTLPKDFVEYISNEANNGIFVMISQYTANAL